MEVSMEIFFEHKTVKTLILIVCFVLVYFVIYGGEDN